MKALIMISLAAVVLSSCGNNTSDTTTTTDSLQAPAVNSGNQPGTTGTGTGTVPADSTVNSADTVHNSNNSGSDTARRTTP